MVWLVPPKHCCHGDFEDKTLHLGRAKCDFLNIFIFYFLCIVLTFWCVANMSCWSLTASFKLQIWFISPCHGHNPKVHSARFKPSFPMIQLLASTLRGLTGSCLCLPILRWVDAGDSSLLLRRQVYYLQRIRKQPRKVCTIAFGKDNLSCDSRFSILSPSFTYTGRNSILSLHIYLNSSKGFYSSGLSGFMGAMFPNALLVNIVSCRIWNNDLRLIKGNSVV